MRSIRFPAEKAPDAIEVIRAAFGVGRELTTVEEARLREAFARYEEEHGRGDLLSPSEYFVGELGDDFRNAYIQTYENRRLESLRTTLKSLAANRCPRCGGSRPGTLDHHLPKKEYAEFSVYPKNLVACCQECNGKKGATVGGNPEETFLHPYFDSIPPVAFIKVDLDVQETHVTATVSFDPDAPIADTLLKARMKYQFEKIDVNARIESEIIEYITERSANISQMVEAPNPTNVADYLRQYAITTDSLYTCGSWQSALLRKLAENHDFCSGGYKVMLPQSLEDAPA
ncbi:HNH endonuclease [Arenibaculum pallidiluteum]|uniref:HNH endonuclease n=1 Tax=Arenibaculum pallidiluteum TaxID=2812559 RepID=UPI001A963039|nr:HNH endonuclease signature motif containing protein [Arenibaculum pallidiluteum]